MRGPCLCGDPYCPHCGNPGAAVWEAFMEEAHDKFEACLQEEKQNAQLAFDTFMCRHIDWVAQSYNKSQGK